MITVIGNMKGGTGKSTVTFNLATWLVHQGKTIRLFDLDPQQTLSDVIEVRLEEAYEPLLPFPEKQPALKTLINDHKTDEILIDVSMSDPAALNEALQRCDRILVPVAPSQADIWSTQRFMKLIRNTCTQHPEILAVINRADTNPKATATNETEDAIDFLPMIKRIKIKLHNRIAYRQAFSEGLAVFELLPKSKASKELIKLAKQLYEPFIN